MKNSEYLSQAKTLETLIKNNITKIQRFTKQGSRPNRIKLLTESVNDDTDNLIDMKQHIYEILEAIPDLTLKSLTQARYIGGMTSDEIARFINYDRDYILRQINRTVKLYLDVPESNEDKT